MRLSAMSRYTASTDVAAPAGDPVWARPGLAASDRMKTLVRTIRRDLMMPAGWSR
jgi:hypothetical protein